MTEQPSPRPGITHYLPRHKGAIRTVAWQTRSGETHGVTGRIDGWAVSTQDDTQYLTMTVGREKKRIPAVAIERHLAATGQLRRPQSPSPVERCRSCGKTLDTGPLGHMDEFSGLEGYCYDCV